MAGVTVHIGIIWGGTMRFRRTVAAIFSAVLLAACGSEPAAAPTVTVATTVPTTVRATSVVTTTATVTETMTIATTVEVTKDAPAPQAAPPVAGDRDQVTYAITASESGSALITYAEDSNFNLAQENGADLPWTKDLTIPEGSFRILSLSAQNSGGGDISCSITVGGQVVDTATSSGDYAIVTCSHNG